MQIKQKLIFPSNIYIWALTIGETRGSLHSSVTKQTSFLAFWFGLFRRLIGIYVWSIDLKQYLHADGEFYWFEGERERQVKFLVRTDEKTKWAFLFHGSLVFYSENKKKCWHRVWTSFLYVKWRWRRKNSSPACGNFHFNHLMLSKSKCSAKLICCQKNSLCFVKKCQLWIFGERFK